ncbi:hypothetical protein [Spiroplasma endosymbiont of Labia minor]|uniref:hypothetical protein n=1 Tax=Spiroplasma endosymbiont of Labia minor TaxID=3066305 RepID=UPI0030D5809C
MYKELIATNYNYKTPINSSDDEKIKFTFNFKNAPSITFAYNLDYINACLKDVEIINKEYENSGDWIDYLNFAFTEVRCAMHIENVDVDRKQIGAIYNNAVPINQNEIVIQNFLKIVISIIDNQFNTEQFSLKDIEDNWAILASKLPDLNENHKQYRQNKIILKNNIATLDPELIPEALEQLILFINNKNDGIHPLVKSFMIELFLLWIHPYEKYSEFLARETAWNWSQRFTNWKRNGFFAFYVDTFKEFYRNHFSQVFENQFDLSYFIKLGFERYTYIIKWSYIRYEIASSSGPRLTQQQIRILIFMKLDKKWEFIIDDFSNFLDNIEFNMTIDKLMQNISKLIELSYLIEIEPGKWKINHDVEYINKNIDSKNNY